MLTVARCLPLPARPLQWIRRIGRQQDSREVRESARRERERPGGGGRGQRGQSDPTRAVSPQPANGSLVSLSLRAARYSTKGHTTRAVSPQPAARPCVNRAQNEQMFCLRLGRGPCCPVGACGWPTHITAPQGVHGHGWVCVWVWPVCPCAAVSGTCRS